MDLELKIFVTRSNIRTILERLRLTREGIQKTKPEALQYIQGSEDTEAKLKDIDAVFYQLELEARLQGRENLVLTRVNLELKERIRQLENELKFKNIDL